MLTNVATKVTFAVNPVPSTNSFSKGPLLGALFFPFLRHHLCMNFNDHYKNGSVDLTLTDPTLRSCRLITIDWLAYRSWQLV